MEWTREDREWKRRYMIRLREVCRSYEETILSFHRREPQKKPDGSFCAEAALRAFNEGRKFERNRRTK